MIERERKKIHIEIGDYFVSITNVAIGHVAMAKYHAIAENMAWIDDSKTQIYLIIKMIGGMSEKDAMNMVFSKNHLRDADYKAIEYNNFI